jgi:hypothetical protein
MFAEMGHWYPWATREYILRRMTMEQFILYYSYIPEDGRLVKKKDETKPDIKSIEKFMKGRKVVEG